MDSNGQDSTAEVLPNKVPRRNGNWCLSARLVRSRGASGPASVDPVEASDPAIRIRAGEELASGRDSPARMHSFAV